jgi:ADP-ribosylation factor related protein 1
VGHIELRDCRLRMWDVGGSSGWRTMWQDHYKYSHAIIFVVDASTELSRINEAKSVFEEVVRDSETYNIPIMLLVNDRDNGLAKPISEMGQYNFHKIFLEDLDQGTDEEREFFIKTICAVQGDGVERSVTQLLHHLKEHAREVDDKDLV